MCCASELAAAAFCPDIHVTLWQRRSWVCYHTRRIVGGIEVSRHLDLAVDSVLKLTQGFALAALARTQGALVRASEICRQAIEGVAAPAEAAGRPVPIAGVIYIALGRVLTEWDHQSEAERLLRKGLHLI